MSSEVASFATRPVSISQAADRQLHSSSSSSRSRLPKLPEIVHPLVRHAASLCDQSNNVAGGGENAAMDVRGLSRDGSRPATVASLGGGGVGGWSGRPLAAEASDLGPVRGAARRFSGASSSRLSLVSRSAPEPFRQLSAAAVAAVPDHVETFRGAADKTKLPVFGSRLNSAVDPSSHDRAQSRIQSGVSDAARARLQIDELECCLREKFKSAYYEMRKRFVDNDPEQKGNVSREALARILHSTLGRPVGQALLARLLERIGLRGDKVMVNFIELYTHLRALQPAENALTGWLDPVQRGNGDGKNATPAALLSAEQVHTHLAEKFRKRFLDLADVFPQLIEGGGGRLLKAEVKNGLSRMHLLTSDEEFEKLWKRYDPLNTGAVSGYKMLHKMGISMRPAPGAGGGAEGANGGLEPISELNDEEPASAKGAKDAEAAISETRRMDAWLLGKFREGFTSLRASLEAADPAKTGLVGADEFVEALRRAGLPQMRRELLPQLAARCAVQLRRGDQVPYRDFLTRYQDRSEAGMVHKVLTDPHHKANSKDKKDASVFDTIEAQLINMFHRDFLTLVSNLRKLDRYREGVVSQAEFRAAISAVAGCEGTLTEAQFAHCMENVPVDEDGRVKYDVYLRQFDTSHDKSLFAKVEKQEGDDSAITGLPSDQASDNTKPAAARRSVPQLHAILQEAFNTRFPELQRRFEALDVYNSQRMTQEMMWELLEGLIPREQVSRAEVAALWPAFILDDRRHLYFREFVRHFAWRPEEAAFPNAKVMPNRLGDSDYRKVSRTLRNDSDLLYDSLRAKVDFYWEDLRREFADMDPFGTGYVTREEFAEVAQELCVQLNDFEVQRVVDKFDVLKDGRVSYVEFLKPFAVKRQPYRHGNSLLTLLRHTRVPAASLGDIIKPRHSLDDIMERLRKQLAGSWRKLRRAFQRADAARSGSLTLPEFRSVLRQAGDAAVTQEDVFHLLNYFDAGLTGRVAYEDFLREVFHPSNRHCAEHHAATEDNSAENREPTEVTAKKGGAKDGAARAKGDAAGEKGETVQAKGDATRPKGDAARVKDNAIRAKTMVESDGKKQHPSPKAVTSTSNDNKDNSRVDKAWKEKNTSKSEVRRAEGETMRATKMGESEKTNAVGAAVNKAANNRAEKKTSSRAGSNRGGGSVASGVKEGEGVATSFAVAEKRAIDGGATEAGGGGRIPVVQQ